MPTGILWQVIYWLSTPVLALVAAILVWRKLVGQFPFFFSYLVVACLADLARLVAYQFGGLIYRDTYWISHLVNTVFIFLATYELFMKRLFPAFYKIRFYRYLFSVAAVSIAALAGLTGVVRGNITLFANVIRTFGFLRVAILFFFVALMVFIGRKWGRYEFGIALGLSIDSAAFLVAFAVFVMKGTQGTVRQLPVFAVDAASLIWLITFLKRKEPTSAPSAPVSPEIVQEAQQWEKTLKHSWTGKKRNQ